MSTVLCKQIYYSTANSGFNLYKHKTTLKGSRQVDVYFYQVEHGYGYNREAGSPVCILCLDPHGSFMCK